jgi:penicillin-insensitive murein DD-endopeptidase
MRFRIALVILLLSGMALAQTPAPQQPVAPPTPDLQSPAKILFGGKAQPAPMATRSIGFYAHGCLAGAVALPINGKTWQVMRLSRNRNWGHPDLIAFLERFRSRAAGRC